MTLTLEKHFPARGVAIFHCSECGQSPSWSGLPESPNAATIEDSADCHAWDCPRTEPPTVGNRSPWGIIDTATPHASGAVFCSTPSHGGFWVPPASRHLIPGDAAQWFEEDCCAHLVAAHLPGFTPEQKSSALEGCRRWDLLPA